ncbi:ESX-1 secretion-associated protein EspK-like [Triticum dicoccoides]|uniref:ESX-1 secretion-associated protein EspK-like n=1 Tax=Triticum dicoccoides TaxID=85692 RepID=UPI00189083B9|nr:ESX-1 secretion-associated protein EspK-like [Triticum dicoccoides]
MPSMQQAEAGVEQRRNGPWIKMNPTAERVLTGGVRSMSLGSPRSPPLSYGSIVTVLSIEGGGVRGSSPAPSSPSSTIVASSGATSIHPNPHDRRGRRLPFRSAVSPATRGETTTRAERRRASRWRPEKAAPEDSGEGVPARLGTGEDAHGQSAAPLAARGSPASLVLGVGVIGEVGAGYDAVGSAIREPERRWAPCVSVGAGSPLRPWGQGRWSSTGCAGRSSAGARMPLRQMLVACATDHAAEGGLPPLDADEAPCPWGPRVRPPSFFATRLSLIEETKEFMATARCRDVGPEGGHSSGHHHADEHASE